MGRNFTKLPFNLSIWGKKHRKIKDRSKVIYLYLWANPVASYYGFYKLPLFNILATGYKLDDVEDSIIELEKQELIFYDWDNEIIVIPEMMKNNTPKSTDKNNIKGCLSAISEIELENIGGVLCRNVDDLNFPDEIKKFLSPYKDSSRGLQGASRGGEESKKTEKENEEIEKSKKEKKEKVSKESKVKKSNIKKENKFSLAVKEIVAYLNLVVGRNFGDKTKKTISLIKQRMKEGYTLEDFKKVIEIKNREWGKDPNFSKFLKPETLFSEKFEGYLNQHPSKQKRPENVQVYDFNFNTEFDTGKFDPTKLTDGTLKFMKMSEHQFITAMEKKTGKIFDRKMRMVWSSIWEEIYDAYRFDGESKDIKVFLSEKIKEKEEVRK